MVAVHRVPRPPAPDAPVHPLVAASAAVDLIVTLDAYGHDDFTEPAEAWSVRLHGTPYRAFHLFVALPDGVDPASCAPGDGLGYAQLDWSLVDDAETAELHVAVLPEQRGRGIGAALFEASEALCTAEGRTVLQSWSFSSPGAGARLVVPASGSGAIDADAPGARWLARRGFLLEQAERTSTLTLAADSAPWAARLARLREEASAAAGADYEVVGWRGPTPPELRAAVAPLLAAMSTDVPSAGLVVAPETFDADRVRVRDERSLGQGRDWVTTAARHRPTGALVGFSELFWRAESPQGIWQEATLVDREHRGHRLGMLVKAANLEALLAANPAARRVHTWNAGENSYMLAINDELGFVSTGFEGAWQRRPAT